MHFKNVSPTSLLASQTFTQFDFFTKTERLFDELQTISATPFASSVVRVGKLLTLLNLFS
jgi:hypothetical protein